MATSWNPPYTILWLNPDGSIEESAFKAHFDAQPIKFMHEDACSWCQGTGFNPDWALPCLGCNGSGRASG